MDEFEFSDDESEATWRRKQLAAEPGKRKLPQASPAHAMHHGAHCCHARHPQLLCWAIPPRMLSMHPYNQVLPCKAQFPRTQQSCLYDSSRCLNAVFIGLVMLAWECILQGSDET